MAPRHRRRIFLLGLVVQVGDSFGNLLAIQRPSPAEILRDQFSQRADLRPLLGRR